MQLPFWSDEDRPFVFWGLGLSLNFKWVARRLGLIVPPAEGSHEAAQEPQAPPRSREDRLREQIGSSKYEDRR